jgi:hypothetical protein
VESGWLWPTICHGEERSDAAISSYEASHPEIAVLRSQGQKAIQ